MREHEAGACIIDHITHTALVYTDKQASKYPGTDELSIFPFPQGLCSANKEM